MKPQILLRIFLVLSMITAGTTFMDCFNLSFLPGLYRKIPEMMEMYGFDEHMTGAMKQIVEDKLSLPQGYHLAFAAFCVLSFMGCLLMWKYRRSGFHCYTLAQLLMLLLPALFIGKGAVAIGDIMFAALFIFIYWRLLKTIEETSTPSDSDLTPSDPDPSTPDLTPSE